MNLSTFTRQIALAQPDHPALHWEGAQLSYAGFEEQVSRIAGGLIARHGLEPGAKVAMAMQNCPEFLAVLFGIWRAGMTAVPINAKLHPREFAWIFENSGAALVIATPDLAAKLEPGPVVISTADRDFGALVSSDPLETPPPGDAPAWLFYTSGTTGRPKGAMLTHANLMAASQAYFADVDFIGPQDVRLHAAPMSHGSGVYALPFLLKGAQNVILSGSFDTGAVYDVLQTHRNVSMFAAPTMVTRLLADPRAGGDTGGLKTLEYGGAPMYVSDLRRALDAFGYHLYQVYGQGEAPMTITHVDKAMHALTDLPDYDALLGSAGYPRTGCEVLIVDQDWRTLPPGEIGEIATRSDNVMTGYHANPEATARALKDGWLMTGDMGAVAADGRLTLKDRSKDMIISGGTNIYPREIEEVLLTSPDVREVAVVGTPHPDWGEEVVAFVVAAPGSTPEAQDLDRLCLDNLARFKRPRRWQIVDHLPKNNYGKIVKTELRERLAKDG